jgi:thiol-disulfide isomerase/thioredoxin
MTTHRRLGVLAVAGLMLLAPACSRSSSPAPSATTEGATAVAPAGPTRAGVPPCPESSTTVPALDDGLPDLTLPCLTAGPPVRLAGLRGEPLVVNVWASWCPPCRDELPYFADAAARTKGDVRFLGLDLLDRTSAALAVQDDFGLPYPSVVDADGAVRGELGVQSPPVTLFVDADGVIVHTAVGAMSSQRQLDALIAEHLGVVLP